MADGAYRFGQPLGQQFFYPQNQQGHPQRLLPRNGSPVKTGRPPFANDTPSPSRSPGPQSPAHNFFNMYGQGHQQGQHPVMNGGPSNRGFNMHMTFAPKFPNQQIHHHHHHPHQQQQQHAPNHHHHHQQQQQQQPQTQQQQQPQPHPQPQQQHQQQNQQQHQQHQHQQPHQQPHQHQQQQQQQPDHGGAAPSVISHQQSFSSGGLSSTTPHFTPGHLQNGAHVSAQTAAAKVSEHWQQQLQLAQDSRQANTPHYYARANAHDNKGSATSATTGQRGEKEEERNRAGKTDEARRQDWMSLDIGGQGLRCLSPSLFGYTFLDKLYMNGNKLTALPAAIGRLKNLHHLDISNNQISELPPELGILVNLKTLLAFDNNLQSLPHELGALYQLDVIGIEGNPLEESLKAEIMRNGTRSLITQLREQAPVALPPSQRDWIVLDETVSSSGVAVDKLSVLTYNILCDRYATSSQYGYVPSVALSWDYRKELIMQEIRAQNADIVCLQEVDADNYSEYFRVQLAYDDYKGVFWPKSRARTMPEKEARSVDGCATLFKHHKYILLDKQCVEFANISINRPDMKGSSDIYNRVMPKDNIAVITFLENRWTGSRIVVVNAHIHWDPAYKDVKLIQVAILLEQVSKMVEQWAKWPPLTDKTPVSIPENKKSTVTNSESNNNTTTTTTNSSSSSEDAWSPPPTPAPSMEYSSGSQIPLVLCGDFNATTASGVYDLLAHGHLSETHSDLEGRTYGNFTRDGMSHPFSLKSSYGTMGELSFTNYTPNFTEVIDYIWYSTNTLHVTGLLGEVDKDYLQRVPGFPNYHFPSDHLALLAEFVVKAGPHHRAGAALQHQKQQQQLRDPAGQKYKAGPGRAKDKARANNISGFGSGSLPINSTLAPSSTLGSSFILGSNSGSGSGSGAGSGAGSGPSSGPHHNVFSDQQQQQHQQPSSTSSAVAGSSAAGIHASSVLQNGGAGGAVGGAGGSGGGSGMGAGAGAIGSGSASGNLPIGSGPGSISASPVGQSTSGRDGVQ